MIKQCSDTNASDKKKNVVILMPAPRMKAVEVTKMIQKMTAVSVPSIKLTKTFSFILLLFFSVDVWCKALARQQSDE